jgi:hypothetical protein
MDEGYKMITLTMKEWESGLWIKKGSLSNILRNYLFRLEESNLERPENFTTRMVDEAEKFNWFTFGFFEGVFRSYEIYVRESFILNVKAGRKK